MSKPFSLRVYLGVSHALMLALSLGVIGYIWSIEEYRVVSREIEEVLRQRILLLADVVSHEISEGELMTFSQNEFPVVNSNEDMAAVYFDNSDVMHQLAPGMVNPLQAGRLRQLKHEYPVEDEAHATLIHTDSDSTSIYAAARVFSTQDQTLGTVSMLVPIDYLDTYILRLRLALVGVTVAVAFLGVLVSLLLDRFLAGQFSQAQRLAASIAKGNYELRIPEDGPTELRNLSHYLNQLAEQLQDQLKTRQSLLANVAHELARPLAGLQLGIESLRKGAINDQELADDLLVDMGQTINRIGRLIDDITVAARPEQNPIELTCTAVYVEPFLKGVATRYWSMANSQEIKLEVQVEANLPPVWADERRLNQIIGNLMDNAIKFSSPGSTVHIIAECIGEDQIRFLIHDGGLGVSSEEASHLFEPFYQGDVGRRIRQGMGLGLAIARQLTLAHGGTLTLENHPEGGTLASLTIPTRNA